MIKVNLHEAATQLSHSVDATLGVEEVVTTRAGKPPVRLSPVARTREPRVLGLDRGRIVIHDDFDEPLTEIEDLLYGDEAPAGSVPRDPIGAQPL